MANELLLSHNKSMANEFLISYYKINDIKNSNLIIKKPYIKKEIKKIKKILYLKSNKDSYNAIDIIDLSLLIDICKSLKLLKNDFKISNDTVLTSIKYTKNSSLKWPIAGSIFIQVSNYYFCINSYRESDYDLEGIMKLKLEGKDSKDSLTISYETDILKELSKSTCEITTGLPRDLISMLFKMIPDINILYIESVLDSLKEKYL